MVGTPPPPLSWSDIPLELAGLVLRRLPALADRARFAAVFRQWCLAAREVPLPAPLPLLALPDGTVYSLPGSKPLHFPGCAGYVDACGDWLAFSGEDGCFLRNPFSHATVAPPQQFRVRDHGARDETGVKWMEMEDEPYQLTMYKLLYCSPQLVAAFVRIHKITRVAVCQPGAASWWSVYMDWHFSLSVDIAFHQGKLYILQNFSENLFIIDISVDQGTNDPWISRVRYAITKIPSAITVPRNEIVTMKMFYLVELDGMLLMVRRWKVRPTLLETDIAILTGGKKFKVFRADFQQSKWIELTNIGDDQVLFLRRRCSRFIPVSYQEMPGDRIIFLDNNDEDHNWNEVGTLDSCSAYDMRDGKVCAFPPMVSWEPGSVLSFGCLEALDRYLCLVVYYGDLCNRMIPKVSDPNCRYVNCVFLYGSDTSVGSEMEWLMYIPVYVSWACLYDAFIGSEMELLMYIFLQIWNWWNSY